VKPPCKCEPQRITRYRARISGPLLDRIDLQLSLPSVDAEALMGSAPESGGERLTTAAALAEVCTARHRQQARQGLCNARLGPEQTLRFCRPETAGIQLLRRSAQQHGLSARSQHRILRVARSIADLAGRDETSVEDVAEALAMRWDS
jgi:magnesium chelatase family protein